MQQLVLGLQSDLQRSEQARAGLEAQVRELRSMLDRVQGELLMMPHAPPLSRPDEQDPIMIAVSRGDVASLALLVSNLPGGRRAARAHGDAPLLRACQLGHLEAARFLVDECGADAGVDHSCALLWAVHNRDAAMAGMLVARGARPDALGGCALRLATLAGDREMLRVLTAPASLTALRTCP